MMRLIVYIHGMDGFVNIPVDRIEPHDPFVCAYRDGQLVAMFDVGSIMTLYLSEKAPNQKER